MKLSRKLTWQFVRLALVGVLAAVAAPFGINVFLRVWAAMDGAAPGYGLAFLSSWKVGVLLALLVLVVVVAWRFVRATPPGLAARGLACLVVIATVVGIGGSVVYRDYDRGPLWAGQNRWGFWRVWAAGIETDFESQNGEVEIIEISTNSHAYRDDEWPVPAPDDGTTRVVLVGDSVVWSLSITRKSDQLDTLLEERLAAGGLGSWDVWNVANAPAALWYFDEAIRRIAPDARARYAIQVVYCPNDLSFHDPQLAMSDKPPWFGRLARSVGFDQDMLWMSHNPWPFDYRTDDPDLLRLLREDFERLLEFIRQREMHLVVWEATTRCDLFDLYRDRPEVTFLNWKEEVGLSCGDEPWSCDFFLDPKLGHPSGHLTPLGMRHVADVLAPALLRLEAARRGAPP